MGLRVAGVRPLAIKPQPREKCQGFRQSRPPGGRHAIDGTALITKFVMEVSQQLPRRARSILYAVVTEFIATGEPVGSRTLVKKYGFDLSAATIRNVLADLDDAGYLAQPHTSAGRVPTEKAFRLFIDALMRVRQLSGEETTRIAEMLSELQPGADLLRETGRLLSDLTGAAAILVRPRIESRNVLKVRFILTRPGEVLSVIVLSDGTVENRFISIDAPISESDLERLHAAVEEGIGNRTLSDLRDHFANSLEESRDELASLRQLGLKLVSAAIDGADRGLDVVVEGQARLLERPELAGTDNMRELMRVLEDHERLVMLLDRTLSSDRVQVFLGEDTGEAVGFPVSLVAAPFQEPSRAGGAVGVIGPTRMDYPSVVPLVGATADAVTAALSRRESARSHETDGRPGSDDDDESA
jgi:heat-inducible transcriptional repressor